MGYVICFIVGGIVGMFAIALAVAAREDEK